MKEVQEHDVHLEIIDDAIVNELLNFIYSGDIIITFDNVKSLLHSLDYLLFEELRETIIVFLKSSLTVKFLAFIWPSQVLSFLVRD